MSSVIKWYLLVSVSIKTPFEFRIAEHKYYTKSLTGGLVFTRLKDKSAVVQGHVTMPLRSDFTPEDVPDSAKETASNWFYKVLHLFSVKISVCRSCMLLYEIMVIYTQV